jgi:hypothetical protein
MAIEKVNYDRGERGHAGHVPDKTTSIPDEGDEEKNVGNEKFHKKYRV